MKQKTPLALLEEWVDNSPLLLLQYLKAKIHELKEVELKNIVDAWERDGTDVTTGEDYFNENYEQ